MKGFTAVPATGSIIWKSRDGGVSRLHKLNIISILCFDSTILINIKKKYRIMSDYVGFDPTSTPCAKTNLQNRCDGRPPIFGVFSGMRPRSNREGAIRLNSPQASGGPGNSNCFRFAACVFAISVVCPTARLAHVPREAPARLQLPACLDTFSLSRTIRRSPRFFGRSSRGLARCQMGRRPGPDRGLNRLVPREFNPRNGHTPLRSARGGSRPVSPFAESSEATTR